MVKHTIDGILCWCKVQNGNVICIYRQFSLLTSLQFGFESHSLRPMFFIQCTTFTLTVQTTTAWNTDEKTLKNLHHCCILNVFNTLLSVSLSRSICLLLLSYIRAEFACWTWPLVRGNCHHGNGLILQKTCCKSRKCVALMVYCG